MGVPCAVVLLFLSPFLVADPDGTVSALTAHTGLPAIGGISLLAQPALARHWLLQDAPAPSPLTQLLMDVAPFVAIAAILLTCAWLIRHRVDPVRASVLL